LKVCCAWVSESCTTSLPMQWFIYMALGVCMCFKKCMCMQKQMVKWFWFLKNCKS